MVIMRYIYLIRLKSKIISKKIAVVTELSSSSIRLEVRTQHDIGQDVTEVCSLEISDPGPRYNIFVHHKYFCGRPWLHTQLY